MLKHIEKGFEYIYSKWDELSIEDKVECFNLFKSFICLLEWNEESKIFECIKLTKENWNKMKDFYEYQRYIYGCSN